MGNFDFRIQPITFAVFSEGMASFGIVAGREYEGAITFSLLGFRMGVSVHSFYSVECRGDNAMVFPPTIEAVLDHFGIPVEEWVAELLGQSDAE